MREVVSTVHKLLCENCTYSGNGPNERAVSAVRALQGLAWLQKGLKLANTNFQIFSENQST